VKTPENKGSTVLFEFPPGSTVALLSKEPASTGGNKIIAIAKSDLGSRIWLTVPFKGKAIARIRRPDLPGYESEGVLNNEVRIVYGSPDWLPVEVGL